MALAQHFGHVYTFEPEPTNFKCLWENVSSRPNVSAFQEALGDRHGYVGMTRPKVGAGLWLVDGDGDIPMTTIDDAVGDIPIDAIVLDVEGMEVMALRGAERTIAKHHPLLWFECIHHEAEIDSFLLAHGYGPSARALDGDKYSTFQLQEAHG